MEFPDFPLVVIRKMSNAECNRVSISDSNWSICRVG